MKGDFSRFIYDEKKQYSLVLMQQGRVQLDSDWNEQALLQWLEIQTLTRDLIGEHGGPRNNLGFKITVTGASGTTAASNFNIGEGRYYVQGIGCKNQGPVTYTEQEAFPFPDSPEKIENEKKYLIYLHVWLRHITNLEDDDIREVALGGPDTTTRIQTVWQVKALDITDEKKISDLKQNYNEFIKLLSSRNIIKKTTGQLQAQAFKPAKKEQPCITSPENRYRGNENQLYRVEIHRSGAALNESGSDDKNCATFKWSRENGSVVFPILKLSENRVTLEHLGRDERFGLKEGDWVEIVDDYYELRRRTEPMFKITDINPDKREITLSGAPGYGENKSKHPLLRRWDHAGQAAYDGALPVEEDKWIELEDGIQIKFLKQPENEQRETWYQSRSWWWIPARRITGIIEWPEENDQPTARNALNTGNHFAPLALLDLGSKNNLTDHRRKFKTMWE